MPELPEVETIANDLKAVLLKAVFEDIEVFNKNSAIAEESLFDELFGAKITEIYRRGKFINLFFGNKFVLTFHLRMTGRIFVNKAKEKLAHERARITFDKAILHFCDVRKFGRIWLNKKSDYEKKTGISKLGIEPTSKEFTFENFSKLFQGKKGSIKSILLRQDLITGIGNIYADEACFYAGIQPESRIQNLNNSDLRNLFSGIKKALTQGIKNRGTSVSDFIDTKGEKGSNQNFLCVYKRAGKPCLICEKPLKKIKLASRTTVFCDNCQKKK